MYLSAGLSLRLPFLPPLPLSRFGPTPPSLGFSFSVSSFYLSFCRPPRLLLPPNISLSAPTLVFSPSVLVALAAMAFFSLARRDFASCEAFSLFSRDSNCTGSRQQTGKNEAEREKDIGRGARMAIDPEQYSHDLDKPPQLR